MRFQVCRMEYEDAVGIGPEKAVSYQEAARILDMKRWGVSQLVDDGELAMLIDADATSDQVDWPNLGDWPVSSVRRAETCHSEALVLGAQSLLAQGPLCEYNVGKQSNGCGLGLKDRRQGEK